MKIEKTCETCELGFDPTCEPQKDEKGTCVNWELSFEIAQENNFDPRLEMK